MPLKTTPKSAFHTAAANTGRAITSAFARAALSRPGQFFVRHAGVISCVSFFTGDIVYGMKHAVPAASFIVADLCLAASDYLHSEKFKPLTRHAVPAAGIATMLGAGLMVYAGWNEPGRTALAISSGLVALQAATMTAQTTLNDLARKFSHSDSGALRRLFQPLAKYPVLTTTITDLAGKTILAGAAFAQRDWRFIAATGLWSNGDGGLICKDKNVLKWLAEKKSAAPPPQKRPAPEMLGP